MNRKSVVGFLIIMSATAVSAQTKGELKIADSTETQVIELSDGSTLTGQIVDILDDAVIFRSKLGISTIARSDIHSVRTIQKTEMRDGKVWFENPHATRLYIGPTGYTLRAGEGYFQSTYIFFVGGALGLTDNIALAAGGSIFPGASEQVFYIAPKIGGRIDKNMHAAVGATILKVPDAGDSFGSIYGVGTYGSRDNNVSVGINYGFGNGEIANDPIFLIGVQARMSRRTSFVSENWILPSTGDGVISLGIRFFNESLAADLGFWRPFDVDFDGGFPFIPYVDFVVVF